MRNALRLIAATASLAACDVGAPTNNASEAVAAAAGPSFAGTTDQATALVTGLGKPWSDGTRKDALRDTQTGGTVRTLTDMTGSAQIFSWPSGAVWQVRLISGGAGGCGDIALIRTALPKLVAGLVPATTMTPVQRTAISDAFNDEGTKDFSLTGAKVSVVGGCRMWLTVTAA